MFIGLELLRHMLRKSPRTVLRMVFLMTTPCVLFLALCHFCIAERTQRPGAPSIVIGGKPTGSPGRRNHIIPTRVVEKLQQLAEEGVEVVPVSYFNLQDIYSFKTFSRIRLSVLMMPEDYIRRHLEPFIDSGTVGEKRKLHCVLGSVAARKWGLNVGDRFFLILSASKIEIQEDKSGSDPMAVEVAGILSEDLESPFYQGAIIIGHTAGKEFYDHHAAVNALVCHSPMGHEAEHVVLAAEQAGLQTLLHLRPLHRSGIAGLAMLAVGAWVAVSAYAILSLHVMGNHRDTRVYHQLGISRFRQASLFAGAGAVITLLVFALSNIGLAGLLMGMEHWRKIASPETALAANYRFYIEPFIALVLLLAGSVLGVFITVCRALANEIRGKGNER